MSAGPLVKLIVGAKTSDLNPLFFPPWASLHASNISAPASQLCLVSSLARERGSAGARCTPGRLEKQPPPPLEHQVPAPALLAAGERWVPGVKPSPTSQPQPSRHQLGRGTFPRCPALFRQGQSCACPPAALGLVQASPGHRIISERAGKLLTILEQGRCTQAVPRQHSGSCGG